MKNTQKKFNMYVPKSRLAYVDTLTDELLEDFSLSDISDYETEYDDSISVWKKEDMETSQEYIQDLRKGIKLLFGAESKQTKYFDRALTKGTIVDTHYSDFATPAQVSSRLETAKKRVKRQASSAGINEISVTELNEAIKYLASCGYEFGRDFNAFNAVDMAKASYLEKCVTDENLIRIVDGQTCDECDIELNIHHVKLNRELLIVIVTMAVPWELFFLAVNPLL